jgi:ribosomal protein S17E/uncharacterized protein YfkK (UPF0435 family)
MSFTKVNADFDIVKFLEQRRKLKKDSIKVKAEADVITKRAKKTVKDLADILSKNASETSLIIQNDPEAQRSLRLIERELKKAKVKDTTIRQIIFETQKDAVSSRRLYENLFNILSRRKTKINNHNQFVKNVSEDDNLARVVYLENLPRIQKKRERESPVEIDFMAQAFLDTGNLDPAELEALTLESEFLKLNEDVIEILDDLNKFDSTVKKITRNIGKTGALTPADADDFAGRISNRLKEINRPFLSKSIQQTVIEKIFKVDNITSDRFLADFEKDGPSRPLFEDVLSMHMSGAEPGFGGLEMIDPSVLGEEEVDPADIEEFLDSAFFGWTTSTEEESREAESMSQLSETEEESSSSWVPGESGLTALNPSERNREILINQTKVFLDNNRNNQTQSEMTTFFGNLISDIEDFKGKKVRNEIEDEITEYVFDINREAVREFETETAIEGDLNKVLEFHLKKSEEQTGIGIGKETSFLRIFSGPNFIKDMINRLGLLVSSQKAGNTSKDMINEISGISDELLRHKEINKDQHEIIQKKYVLNVNFSLIKK